MENINDDWHSLALHTPVDGFLSLYNGPYRELIEINNQVLSQGLRRAGEVNRLVLLWQDYSSEPNFLSKLKLITNSFLSGGGDFYIKDEGGCRMVTLFNNPIFKGDNTAIGWAQKVNNAMSSAISPYSPNLIRTCYLSNFGLTASSIVGNMEQMPVLVLARVRSSR